jgi:hypothetical protein
LGRQQDGSRACSENGTALPGEFSNRFGKTFFLQELQLCRAFAARQNESVAALKIRGGSHLRGFRAQPLEHRCVRRKISLDRQNPDFHFTNSSFCPHGLLE